MKNMKQLTDLIKAITRLVAGLKALIVAIGLL